MRICSVVLVLSFGERSARFGVWFLPAEYAKLYIVSSAKDTNLSSNDAPRFSQQPPSRPHLPISTYVRRLIYHQDLGYCIRALAQIICAATEGAP
jgi:hypothetical protein